MTRTPVMVSLYEPVIFELIFRTLRYWTMILRWKSVATTMMMGTISMMTSVSGELISHMK